MIHVHLHHVHLHHYITTPSTHTPQAWRADVDDPDCPWAPVMLVEDAWKLLHAHDDGSDDDHINADHQESVATLHDALLARVLQEDAQGGPQQGPQLLGVVRDVLHGLLGGTPALAGVLEAAVVALGGGAGLGRGQRGEAGGLDAWVDAAAATVIKLSKVCFCVWLWVGNKVVQNKTWGTLQNHPGRHICLPGGCPAAASPPASHCLGSLAGPLRVCAGAPHRGPAAGARRRGLQCVSGGHPCRACG